MEQSIISAQSANGVTKMIKVLGVLMLIFLPLQAPFYTYPTGTSPYILIGSDDSIVDKMPLFSWEASPEGYTLFDLEEIWLWELEVFLIDYYEDGQLQEEGSIDVAFTRYLDGEPYLEYYCVANFTQSGSVEPKWNIPFEFVEVPGGRTVEADFEIDLRVNVGGNVAVGIVIKTHWLLTWIQREEPIPWWVIFANASIIALLVAFPLSRRFLRKREDKRITKSLKKVQEKRRNERRERKWKKSRQSSG